MQTQLRYITAPDMQYELEEVWFPLSEDILAWETDFHVLMLNDQIRMCTYEQAIKQVVKHGMTVLDLGVGTGILSLWALEAGAAHVYGVDVNNQILLKATERILNAKFAQKFSALNDLSYDVELPDRVDLIVSEILGNLGDNEDMTPILNDARQRFLKPGGMMLPQQVETFLVPVEAAKAHAQVHRLECRSINATYNLADLMQKLGMASPFQLYYDVILSERAHLSQPKRVKTFQFDGSDEATYKVEQQFEIERDGMFTGFKGYFVARLANGVELDISGDDIVGRGTSDCWKHSYLPVEVSFAVKQGDVLDLMYSRFYPADKQSPFRQCYAWKGIVRRLGRIVHQFEQSMG